MTRVVILDHSVSARRTLRAQLEAERDLDVVREFSDPTEATRFLLRATAELLIIDAELLSEGGLDAIEALMMQRPLPILILSASEHRPEQDALLHEALLRGALSIEARVSPSDPQASALFRSAVRRLLRVSVVRQKSARSQHSQRPLSASSRPEHGPGPLPSVHHQVDVIGIGASAGGPGVVADILSALPKDLAACILVVQHLPAGFAEPFADYLRARIRLPVTICSSLQPLSLGQVILAPDDAHLLIRSRGLARTEQSEPLHGHRPSVDLLMDSLARHYGERAAGVILSGIGRDGAAGLRTIRQAGGLTISQDGESAAVYGMPRVASESGAAEFVLRPSDIVDALRRAAGPREPSGRSY